MMSPESLQPLFDEANSGFYDLEYQLSMEYRYLSGAHGSKVRNILSLIEKAKGLHCLDIGCGGGYFTNILHRRGADVIGIDYSEYAIKFGRSRFPNLDLRVHSAYELDSLGHSSFDLVTLLDTIEHLGDQQKVVSGIYGILKHDGLLVISTDIEDGPWSKPPLSKLVSGSLRLSAEGRAYRVIKRVESFRRQFKDYHLSHISPLNYGEIEKLLNSEHCLVIEHRVYPLVGVPVRDCFFRLLPKAYRGNHQTIVAKKIT